MATRRYTPIIDTPIFLKFVEHYYNIFRSRNGFGRWLYEYNELEQKGLFKPTIIREMYKLILKDKFTLGYIKEAAYYHIGVYAQDAAQAYDDAHNGTYKICVITGETALDDDDDGLVQLSYDEATQICNLMNEEAEELLFVVKPD